MSEPIATPAARQSQIAVATAVVATLTLGALTMALLGVATAVPATAVLLLALAEAARAAWVSRATLLVGAEGLVIDGPGRPGLVAWDDVSWLGLTRRGLVIDARDGRHTLFDHAVDESVAALTLTRSHEPLAVPIVVRHDLVRRAVASVAVLVATGLLAAIVIGGVVADLTIAERTATLVTSVPLMIGGLGIATRLLLSPWELTMSRSATSARSLLRTSITSEATASVSTAQTPIQRLIGAPPGERLVITAGSRSWHGPIAAPNTFASVAGRINALTSGSD